MGHVEYLLTADVARLLQRTPAAVRAAAAKGRLQVEARTRGGTRLFTNSAVERFRKQMANRQAARRRHAAGVRGPKSP